jgi:transglutaminase-like putative cysteine protease
MHLGLTRRNIGRLVLLAWAVMLAWLARRQFAPQGSAGVLERTKRLEPGAQYFAVLVAGRQIGQLNLTADTLIDVVRLTEQFVLDLPVGDSTKQLARGTEYYLSRALRLRNFTRTAFGVGPSERLDATLGGDSILGLTDSEGDSTAAGQVRLRVDPDAIMPGMLPYRAAFGGHLRVGEDFTVQLIELGGGGTRPLQVRVAAESTFIVPDSASWDSVAARWVPATTDTVRAWRLDHDAPGAPTRSWVDAGGALIRQETAGGLTLRRSAFEIVSNNYRRSRRAESSTWRRGIPGMISLAAAGQLPDTGASVREFLLQADSVALLRGTARLLEGGRQSLRGDTLRVSRHTEAAGKVDETLMARGPSWDLAVLDDEIQHAATEALSRAKTAQDSARALTRWVARQIATDGAPAAFGTARNVLRERRGNADGKARLLATMARIAGIPARVVTGIAVLRNGVFSHSWTELWLGRWVAADPSFGHFPASASLIRIALGERSRPIDLLPLVGSARFLPLRTSR